MSTPRARTPDLVEQHEDRILMIWASAGAWIVADHPFRQLVGALDGRGRLDKVVRRLARKWKRPPQVVAREVYEALDMLRSMGVIGPLPAEPVPLEIANVTVNVTNRCNLRCTHCYNDPGGDELDAAVIAKALRAARPALSAGASLILLGGEPLLAVDRLVAIVEGARSTFPAPPMLSSNGTLIDRELATRLADLDVDIQISLDGPDAATNDPVRGEGSFDRAVRGVRHLVDQGVPVTLSMVYDRTNYTRLEAYADLAIELGASEVRYIPMRRIGRAAGQGEAAPDQAEVLDHLLALLERRPEIRALLRRDFFTITREVCRRGGARTHCGIGRRVIFVDADGAVYPCPNHRLPGLACGNVADTPLAELLRDSPVMVDVRRRYRSDRYSRCASCAVRPWCSGDCRGEVLAVTGDAAGEAPHCEEMRRIIPRLMWLIADGDPRLATPTGGASFL